MTDFLDDILKRFRPSPEADSAEGAESPTEFVGDEPADAGAEESLEIAPQTVEKVELEGGVPSADEIPPADQPGGAATEMVPLPVRPRGRRRPSEVQGETPTENIELSLEDLVREINVLRGEIRTRDRELKKREATYATLLARYNELENEKKRYQVKTSDLELQLNSYITKLEAASENVDKLSARLKLAEEEKARSDRLLAQAQSSIDGAPGGGEGDESTEQILKEKARFQQKSNQMEVQLNALISQMEESQREVSEAREEVERLRKERDRLVSRVGEVKSGPPHPSPASGTAFPSRPDDEVHTLEEKLSAILDGDVSAAPGEGQGPPPTPGEPWPDRPVENLSSLVPDSVAGSDSLLSQMEHEETERIVKEKGSLRFHAAIAQLGDPSVEKRILDDNRSTLKMILSGGGVSPLGLGALVADLDKALHEGTVSAFTITNARDGEDLEKLYCSTKLSMALARELGYEAIDVRKVGICALIVLGNGKAPDATVREEFSKIIAVAGTYGGLVASRSPMLPGEAVGKIISYVEEGKLDGEYVKSFVRMASLFPPGSWVQLSTGEIGMVIATNPSDARRPIIRIHFGEAGQSLPSPRKVNLSDTRQVSIARPVGAPPPSALRQV